MVLKLSLSEPAVRHSVLALSSLHEYTNRTDNDGKLSNWNFAFREYGKAMIAMRSWSPQCSDDPAAIPLLVCLLFVCIEFLAGHEAASQLHICQGRKILSELGDASSGSPAMDMIKRELVPIYTRLSLSSFTFGSRPSAIPWHLKVSASVPAEFSSLDESRHLLYQILDEALDFSTKGKSAVYALEPHPAEVEMFKITQQYLLSQLTRWNNAFTILTARDPALNQAALNLLMLYYHAALVWISVALQRFETAYDAHTAGFSSIIFLASSIIRARPPGESTDAFGFESEVIGPLYWTATKCRHPLLRREALRLLMRDEVRNRRENLWHGAGAAFIAARVIQMEERHQGPGWNGDALADQQHYFQHEFIHATKGRTTHLGGTESPEPYEQEVQVPLSQPPTFPPGTLASPYVDKSSSDSMSDSASTAEAGDYTPDLIMPQRGPRGPRFYIPIPSGSEAKLALSSQSAAANLEPPYGIQEHRRVKNALIGPKEGAGTWLTVFMEPGEGETKWKITREFIRL